MLQDIRDAIAADRPDELNRTAHRFKGSLIYLAAKPAADLAGRLEAMAKTGDIQQAKKAYTALAHECNNVKSFIAQYHGK